MSDRKRNESLMSDLVDYVTARRRQRDAALRSYRRAPFNAQTRARLDIAQENLDKARRAWGICWLIFYNERVTPPGLIDDKTREEIRQVLTDYPKSVEARE